MKNVFLAGFAAVALVAGTMSVGAVDVINEDNDMREINVSSDGVSSAYEVLPGDALKGICQRCVISVEDGVAVEVAGDHVAVIKDGKIQLKSKVN